MTSSSAGMTETPTEPSHSKNTWSITWELFSRSLMNFSTVCDPSSHRAMPVPEPRPIRISRNCQQELGFLTEGPSTEGDMDVAVWSACQQQQPFVGTHASLFRSCVLDV